MAPVTADPVQTVNASSEIESYSRLAGKKSKQKDVMMGGGWEHGGICSWPGNKSPSLALVHTSCVR